MKHQELMKKIMELQQGSNKASVGYAYPGTEEYDYYYKCELGDIPNVKLEEIRSFVRNAIAYLSNNDISEDELLNIESKVDNYLSLFPIKEEEKRLR